MPLIIDSTVKIFDLNAVQRGDCVRVRRIGDSFARNGFITKASEKELQILFCNVQNNAASYLAIPAADVALGLWEIFWTRDFQTVNEYRSGDSDA